MYGSRFYVLSQILVLSMQTMKPSCQLFLAVDLEVVILPGPTVRISLELTVGRG